MRIITHLNDLTDMVLAMRSVKMTIEDGATENIFLFEDGTDTYVKKNKTGWTVRVRSEKD